MPPYEIDPRFFSDLGVDGASQPKLFGAQVSFGTSVVDVDVWTNQHRVPWLGERLVIVNGLIDAAATTFNKIFDVDCPGFVGFELYNHSLPVPSRTATVIPLHRGGNGPWLQSDPAWISFGKEGPDVFRLRYEDSPSGGRATAEDPDIFLRIKGELASDLPTYGGLEGGDDKTRIKIYCVSFLNSSRTVVGREQFSAIDANDADFKAAMATFEHNRRSLPAFQASSYSLQRGRC